MLTREEALILACKILIETWALQEAERLFRSRKMSPKMTETMLERIATIADASEFGPSAINSPPP